MSYNVTYGSIIDICYSRKELNRRTFGKKHKNIIIWICGSTELFSTPELRLCNKMASNALSEYIQELHGKGTTIKTRCVWVMHVWMYIESISLFLSSWYFVTGERFCTVRWDRITWERHNHQNPLYLNYECSLVYRIYLSLTIELEFCHRRKYFAVWWDRNILCAETSHNISCTDINNC
jgi:hypothetical protein